MKSGKRRGCWLALLGAIVWLAGCGTEPDLESLSGEMVTGCTEDFLAPQSCHRYDSNHIERACGVDQAGRDYNVFREELSVIPGCRRLGAFLQFKPGEAPESGRVTTEGKLASVRAYAANWPIEGGSAELPDVPCCPEDDEKNRVPICATLSKDGGLLVETENKVSGFTQFVVVLDYDRLFPELYPIHHDRPPTMASVGFVVRYYVE